MSTKTLDETGLVLADELRAAGSTLIGGILLMDYADPDNCERLHRALDAYDAWRAQPEGEALPELSESQREQYDWWRGAAAAIPGFMAGRLDSAADRLEREAQAAREKASELEPVIAHLRADARRAER